MSADDPKAVPILADDFEALAKEATPGEWSFDKSIWAPGLPGKINGAPSRSRVLIAMLTNVDDGAFIAFCGTNRDSILAALRAVEDVRALPCASNEKPCGYQRREMLAYERGYRDAVEAVQALLEGE